MPRRLFARTAIALLAALTLMGSATAGAQDAEKLETSRTGGGPGSGTRWGGADDYSANPGDTCMGERITIRATGFGTTNGTSGADVIAGTDGNDVIYGRGGDDIICGFDGDDIIYGDHNDVKDSSGGLDTINGGKGNDDIYGGPRQDFIHGSSGSDVIYGDLPTSVHGTQDNIEGGNGNDVIVGGPGSDLVWGDRMVWGSPNGEDGFGHDIIDSVADNAGGHDEVWGGAGNDRIWAKDGIGQNVWGQSGNDTCGVDKDIDLYDCEILE